jgi:LmbE family N-acetylglucosaminyl deacetylase
MDSEGFRPHPTQQAWLDSLPEERRHEAAASLEALSVSGVKLGKALDNVADLMLPGANGQAAVDLLMWLALGAEAVRALGRGEGERARELFESATRSKPSVLPQIVIVPEEPGGR